MKLTIAQKLALASVVCEDLDSDELKAVITEGSDCEFDYNVENYTPPMSMISPCPACPEGEEGEGYELEFTVSIFCLDVDIDKIPSWVYEEIQQAIYEEDFE